MPESKVETLGRALKEFDGNGDYEVVVAAARELITYDDTDGERCHECGSPVGLVWWCHDDLLWEVVTGRIKPAGSRESAGGIYCIPCFDRHAREVCPWIEWAPVNLRHLLDKDVQEEAARKRHELAESVNADRRQKVRGALMDVWASAGKSSSALPLAQVLVEAVVRSADADGETRQREILQAIAVLLGVRVEEILTLDQATERLSR